VGERALGFPEPVRDVVLGIISFGCLGGVEFCVEGLQERGEAGCDSGSLVELNTYNGEGSVSI